MHLLRMHFTYFGMYSNNFIYLQIIEKEEKMKKKKTVNNQHIKLVLLDTTSTIETVLSRWPAYIRSLETDN